MHAHPGRRARAHGVASVSLQSEQGSRRQPALETQQPPLHWLDGERYRSTAARWARHHARGECAAPAAAARARAARAPSRAARGCRTMRGHQRRAPPAQDGAAVPSRGAQRRGRCSTGAHSQRRRQGGGRDGACMRRAPRRQCRPDGPRWRDRPPRPMPAGSAAVGADGAAAAGSGGMALGWCE